MGEYYAHRREDGALQTVLEHLSGTAEYAREFGRASGMEDAAAYAAMLHDAGKYTEGFQRRLLRGGAKVDHATAGAKEAVAARQIQAAFAIAGHHTGLPDLGDKSDGDDQPTLRGKLKRRPGAGIEDYAAFRGEVVIAPPPPLPQTDWLGDFLRTHLLFSALVDADWLDTERFMSAGAAARGAGEGVAALAQKLDAWIAQKGWRRPTPRPDMSLNERRSDILYACIDAAALAPGLFTLTVPTGGGKTVSSLAFALRHAALHSLDRVIYVIPYTSIVDQTAKTFREILGDENVLEHHSQVSFDPEDDRQLTPAEKRLQLATENWD
ncbi:MAG: CRISPR-associated endonuclease Cas3'', partial [Clostridiales bacterium]|nr:CRISPR-associated endonuclease Cas3'' [Clostridiales bacterium]